MSLLHKVVCLVLNQRVDRVGIDGDSVSSGGVSCPRVSCDFVGVLGWGDVSGSYPNPIW